MSSLWCNPRSCSVFIDWIVIVSADQKKAGCFKFSFSTVTEFERAVTSARARTGAHWQMKLKFCRIPLLFTLFPDTTNKETTSVDLGIFRTITVSNHGSLLIQYLSISLSGSSGSEVC